MSPAPSPGSAPAITSWSSGSDFLIRSKASIAVCGSVQRSTVPVWQTYGRVRSTPSERSTWPESFRGSSWLRGLSGSVAGATSSTWTFASRPRRRSGSDGIGRGGVLVAAPGAARDAGAGGRDAAERRRVVDDDDVGLGELRLERARALLDPLVPLGLGRGELRAAERLLEPLADLAVLAARERAPAHVDAQIGHQRQQRAQVVRRLRAGRIGRREAAGRPRRRAARPPHGSVQAPSPPATSRWSSSGRFPASIGSKVALTRASVAVRRCVTERTQMCDGGHRRVQCGTANLCSYAGLRCLTAAAGASSRSHAERWQELAPDAGGR